MKGLSAVVCACSIVVAQVTLAVDASPHPPQDGWAARATVPTHRSTPVHEEMRRLEEERRRELAEQLRSLAVLHVLQPTDSPFLWQLLGSDSGAAWSELGFFTVREGEVPPITSGERLQVRFLAGDLHLTDGSEIRHVVASVSSLADTGLVQGDQFLFFVHSVEEDAQQAIAEMNGAIRSAVKAPNLDLGQSASLGQEEAPVAETRSMNAATNTCLTSCDSSYYVNVRSCDTNYSICFTQANAVFAACTFGCASLGEACFPVCAGTYFVMTSACIATQVTCSNAARAQLDFCYANCPQPACPAFSRTLADDTRSIASAFCSEPRVDTNPVSPIVIDLDGRGGFRFTDAPGGVMFDLDAEGVAERTAWTAPGYDQAFLVLDRNGNGFIDDGSELFGDRTAQPESAHPNGYLALKVFDSISAGGNEGGTIDPSDAVFPLLRLWTDENHDGVSQPAELRDLAGAGIEILELDYVVSNRRDRHGNLLRYKSRVQTADRVVESTDVFFVPADGE